MFKAPPLTAKPGKLFYAALVPVWWSTAFVIAAAIPDYFGFISVISASTLLNMTYTLPPLLALAYDIRRCAMQVDQGEGFDGNTGIVTRNVTGVRRFVRGFLSGGIWQIAINVWHLIYFLASLAMCVLGMYAAVDGLVYERLVKDDVTNMPLFVVWLKPLRTHSLILFLAFHHSILQHRRLLNGVSWICPASKSSLRSVAMFTYYEGMVH